MGYFKLAKRDKLYISQKVIIQITLNFKYFTHSISRNEYFCNLTPFAKKPGNIVLLYIIKSLADKKFFFRSWDFPFSHSLIWFLTLTKRKLEPSFFWWNFFLLLYFYKFSILHHMEYYYHVSVDVPGCYMSKLDNLQKKLFEVF